MHNFGNGRRIPDKVIHCIARIMSEGESLEIKRLASLRRLARMSKFNVDNLGVAIA